MFAGYDCVGAEPKKALHICTPGLGPFVRVRSAQDTVNESRDQPFDIPASCKTIDRFLKKLDRIFLFMP